MTQESIKTLISAAPYYRPRWMKLVREKWKGLYRIRLKIILYRRHPKITETHCLRRGQNEWSVRLPKFQMGRYQHQNTLGNERKRKTPISIMKPAEMNIVWYTFAAWTSYSLCVDHFATAKILFRTHVARAQSNGLGGACPIPPGSAYVHMIYTSRVPVRGIISVWDVFGI